MKKIITYAVMLAMLLFASICVAEVPQMINYQGRLTDTSGDPVADGQYDLVFTIYGNEGVIVWQEIHSAVQTTSGLFDALLGAGNHSSFGELTAGVFGDSARWLGITVGEYGTDPEMTPRTKLSSVPYALRSHSADSSQYADDADKLDGYDATDFFSGGFPGEPSDVFRCYGDISDGAETDICVSDNLREITSIFASSGPDDTTIGIKINGNFIMRMRIKQGIATWYRNQGAGIKVGPSEAIGIQVMGGGDAMVTITGFEY